MPADLSNRSCLARWATFAPTPRNPHQRYCSPPVPSRGLRRRERDDTARLDERAEAALRAIREDPAYDGGPVSTQLLNELKRTRMDPD